MELIECSLEWESRVLNQFQSRSSSYRSEDEIGKQAVEHCDRRYTGVRRPLPETWNWGNRTFQCIQDNKSVEEHQTRRDWTGW